MRTLAELLTLTDVDPADPTGPLTGELTEDWAQGRAGFGGAVAAMGLAAWHRRGGGQRPLRSVMVDFVRPTAPGPVRLVVQLLGEGRSTRHASVRVEQDGACTATLTIVEGEGRASPLRQPAPAAAPLAEDAVEFSYVEGMSPAFTRHFTYRMAPEAMPFANAARAGMDGVVRNNDGQPVDLPALLCLADAFPAPVLAMVGWPTPISTATWLFNIVDALPADGGPGWWRYRSGAVAVGDGYADVDGWLWAPDGRLIATSRQLVAEFAKA